MADWQPIETAPKRTPKPDDNIATGHAELILGWEDSSTVLMGYWEPGRDENGGWDQAGGGRWDICSSGIVPSPPTHWMPLPEPPNG